MKARRFFLASVLIVSVTPWISSALITGSTGNQPVSDPGWPDGALAMANLPSRVGWWEGPPFGGGEWQFLYRGDSKTISDALTNFAAVRAPSLELVMHDGPETNIFIKDSGDGRVDWTFTVWVPESWHHLYNNPAAAWDANDSNFHKPVAAPRLDVYIGSGQVDWSQVKVPAGLQVRDERASASTVDLSGGSVVQAEVFDMDTGKTIRAAHLIVEKTSWTNVPEGHWETAPLADVETDATGRAEVAKIPADAIKVSIAAPGYVTRRLTQQGNPRPALLKFSTQLAKSSSIRGVVTDAEGKPIAGAKVYPASLLGSDGFGYDTGFQYEPIAKSMVTTDAAGSFELPNMPAGYAQISVTAPGYYFGDILSIHPVPTTNLTLRLERAGKIAVSVSDKNGKPLSRFEGNPLLVNVESADGRNNWSGGAMVGNDSTASFENVPPGKYRVTSRPNPATSNRDYAPEQTITVEGGKDNRVRITYN
jgi:hypothetical protein